LAKETEIPKTSQQDHVDNFFDSQGIVHKEFVPEGKTVKAEFYKGVMDCFIGFVQLHSALEIFSCCTIMRLPQSCVCQFLTPKNVTTLYHPPYSPDLSPPDYFLFPKLKMKLQALHFAAVAEIQEAVTDELRKVQIQEFLAAFQELYDCTKACIYASGAYFE
jgi:histone-lysine N-methyltransferase SETMAR